MEIKASSVLTALLTTTFTTSMQDAAVTSTLLLASHCPSSRWAIACSSPSPVAAAAAVVLVGPVGSQGVEE